MKKIILLIISFTSFIFAEAQATYTPVDAGSKVHFVIKNFGIKVGGDFTGLKGVIKFDPVNFAASSFDVTVDANTINTDNGMRDDHLRESEYFDVEKYKTISFKSTKVVKSSKAGRFFVFGDLTIKNVTKPVQFAFGATPKDGGYIFDGQFEINRRDFGIGSSSISLADVLKVNLTVFAK
jgi:polyisoprenoid-binding protein YceI